MSYVRRYERVPFFCEAELADTAGLRRLPARTLDISLGGVGLTTAAALPRGTSVEVTFVLREGTKSVHQHVLGRVAFAASDEDGCRMGIEFVAPVRETTHPELMRRILKA
jgi:c-di-GMP-binding flagellar brake protein YcgR